MLTQGAPRFLELPPEECRALLARNHVGRIAFSQGGQVDVEPIHYIYDEQWLYGRTAPGTKLDVIRRNYWVALEVDEVEDLFRWRSVVVRGGFYVLTPDGAAWQQQTWEHALRLLRGFLPESFTLDDPAPFRTVVFRIAVQELTGRAAFDGG